MKTFLGIGAGPGIGFATAERFAAEGFHVILSGRDGARLDGLRDRLVAGGRNASTLVLDAADLGAVRDAVQRVAGGQGIDVLHYNAAAIRQATLEQQPPETVLSDLAVGVGGALAAAKAAEPIMAKTGGTILLTGGGLALRPNPEYLLLGIGKAAIRNMAHALFEPFRAKNIHIATVTISAYVDPGSAAAMEIARRFWALHASAPDAWVPEATYPD